MHEFSIATQVLEAARDAAADHGSDTFEGISVSVGEASHVNPDQLATCLEAAADSTVGDLDIEIETVAPYAECECGWSGEPETLDRALAYAPNLTCPECDARLELARGNECRLMSVTIPDGDAEDDDGAGKTDGLDADTTDTQPGDSDAQTSDPEPSNLSE